MFRQNNVKQSKLSKYFQNEQNMIQNFYFIKDSQQNVFLFFRNHFPDYGATRETPKKQFVYQRSRACRDRHDDDVTRMNSTVKV